MRSLKAEGVQSSVEGVYIEEEMELRAIFASCPDAIIVSDLNGNITDCNQATLDMGGFSSKDEVVGKNALEFIAEKDRERAMENLEKTLEQGSVRNIEYTFLTKDGREYPAELSASVIKDSSGNPIGFVAITKDITERKKAEEALWKSKEFAENLVASMKDGFSVLDSQGVHLNVNKALCRMTGFTRKELIGVGPPHPYWPEEEYGNIESTFQKTLRGEFEDFELIFKRKSGERFPAIVSPSWITDKEGNVISYFATVKEITERKKIEEKLKESEEKFRSLVHTIPECVYSALPNGEILYMSPAVETIFGYSAEEFQKDKNLWIRLIHKDDKKELLTKFERLLEKGVPYVHEFRMKRKDGDIVWIRDHADAVLDEEGRPTRISGIIYDITKRKQVDEALVESEGKYRGLFEGANDTLVYLDFAGRVLDINQKVEELTGIRREEFLGKYFWELGLLSLRDVPRFIDLMKSVKEEPTEGLELKITRKDGGKRFAEVSSTRMRKDRAPRGFLAIIRDVTERKQAEKRIRESEERFRNLFENARDVIITFDLKGNMTSINKAIEEYGFEKDEMIGKNMLKFVSKKYWPRLLKELAKISRGKPVEGEIGLVTPKGEKMAEYRSNPIRRGKKVVGFQTIMRDITERKAMERKLQEYAEHLEEKVEERTRELRKSEERYSSMVNDAIDSLDSGILILDKDFKVIWINKAIEKFFGVDRDSLIGVDKRKAIKEKIKYVFEDPRTI